MARHFFASQKGILSNEDEVLDAGTASDTGSDEALKSLEAEGQVVDAEVDAAANADDIEKGLDGVVALENMRITLRAANENGGMDRYGAAIAKQHADFVLQTFLKSPVGLTMPSNESFGGAGSRVGSGVLTMESIKEKAGEIWKAIVKFLKKMKDKVMAWINKIFGAAEKLAKRAEAIKSRADGTKGSAKEKTFDSDPLFNSLAVKEALDGALLKTGLGVVATMAETMVEKAIEGNKNVSDFVEKMNSVKDSASLDAAGDAFNKQMIAMAASPKIADSVELPGNVVMRNPKVIDAGQPSARWEGYGLPSNGAKAKTGAKVATLDLDTIKSICATVKSIADTLVAARKVEPESTKAYKQLEEFAQKHTASSNLEDSKDEDMKSLYSDMVKEFKQATSIVDGPIKALGGYCLKTARSSLDYCDASLGQYA